MLNLKLLSSRTLIRLMARYARPPVKVVIKPDVKHASINKMSKGSKEIVFGGKSKSIHLTSTSPETFEALNLRPDVISALENLSIVHPTVIQRLCIPLVNDNKNIFCAAQTGSGKTMIYATPIISRLKTESDNGFINRLSRPRALVIAPSRELAHQILKVFKSLSHVAPIRSLGLIGQRQKKWAREYLKGVCDVVVGTPNTVLKYHKRGLLLLSDLRFLVIDEADTLLDENFRDVTFDILNACGIHENSSAFSPKNIQCVLAAATLPSKGILSRYEKYIPNLEVCQSNLHKVLPHVKHSFHKTTQQQKFDMALKNLKKLLRKPSRQCVIFCNTSKSCNFVSVKLSENNIEHSKLHGNMNPQVRFQDFEIFCNKETRVLVCTDLASRGLDTSEVVLVINFDCPFNTADYLHRAGRTGRAREIYTGEGEVITYITQNKEVLFARKIQSAAEKNESLDDVTSKKNSLKTRYEKNMTAAIKRMKSKTTKN